MFRYFESLVDPYAPYPSQGHAAGPAVAVPADYLRPARRVMAWTVLSVFAVAVIEIWLIWYAGRIVDVLGDTPPRRGLGAARARAGAGRAASSCSPAR